MDTAHQLASLSSPLSPRLVRAMLVGHPTTTGITILSWPEEADRRENLVAAGQPTLLLVPDDAVAPICSVLEEWVRLPAPMDDVYARLEMLRGRAVCSSAPVLRPGGVVAFGSGYEVIPAAQLPLVKVLIEGFRSVVHRQDLADAYEAAGGTPSEEALKAAMFRLGRRLSPLGLDLRTIRAKGYMLDADTSCRTSQPPV